MTRILLYKSKQINIVLRIKVITNKNYKEINENKNDKEKY